MQVEQLLQTHQHILTVKALRRMLALGVELVLHGDSRVVWQHSRHYLGRTVWELRLRIVRREILNVVLILLLLVVVHVGGLRQRDDRRLDESRVFVVGKRITHWHLVGLFKRSLVLDVAVDQLRDDRLAALVPPASIDLLILGIMSLSALHANVHVVVWCLLEHGLILIDELLSVQLRNVVLSRSHHVAARTPQECRVVGQVKNILPRLDCLSTYPYVLVPERALAHIVVHVQRVVDEDVLVVNAVELSEKLGRSSTYLVVDRGVNVES